MTVGMSVCIASTDLEALRERLLSAVEAGDVATLKSLLESHPGYVDAVSSGSHLIHLAAMQENPELTRLLLQDGANVHVSAFSGERPLHFATNRRIAALLLEAGAELDATNGKGWTALDMALQRKNVALAEFLLDKGADPKASRSKPPTLVFALGLSPRLSSRIIERGVDIQFPGDDEQQLPLFHAAIQALDVGAVRAMMKRGASIRSRARDGSSVLHPLARMWSTTREAPGFAEARMRMARFLLEQGADVNAQDKDGATVLHLLAADPDAGPLVRLLIQRKADFRARDHQGQAPLHRAATAGAVPLVALLLEAGTRADALDGEGRTPLHLAIEAMTGWESTRPMMNNGGELVRVPKPSPPHEKVVSLLLRAGADIHREDKRGRTPLGLAREFGLPSVVEQLTARKGAR